MMDNSQGWMLYQPTIVALGAVVFSTIGNTLLAWERHRLAEQKEIVILRRTLLLELQLVQSYLRHTLDMLKGPGMRADFAFPSAFANLEQSAARAGQLPWDEGFEVSKGVGALFLFMEALMPMRVSTSTRYQSIIVDEAQKGSIAAVAQTAYERTSDAIEVLNKGKI